VILHQTIQNVIYFPTSSRVNVASGLLSAVVLNVSVQQKHKK